MKSNMSTALSALARNPSALDWSQGPDSEENLRRLGQNLLRCGVPAEFRADLLSAKAQQPAYKSEKWRVVLAELILQAKNSDGWLPLIPITEGRPQVPKFDIEKLIPGNIPQFKGYITATSESLQVSPEMIALLCLAAVGTAAAGAFQIQAALGWSQPSTFMVLILADSGERKSAVYTVVLDPVRQWQANLVSQLEPVLHAYNQKRDIQRKTIERCKGKLADPFADPDDQKLARVEIDKAEMALRGMPPIELPTLLASDSTPEGMTRLLANNPDHRLGVFSDEGEFIEIMVGRYSGNPAVERFCKATDGMPISVCRAKGAAISIPQPLISGGIFSQPIVAARLIEDPVAWQKGVAARFLPCWPESRVGSRTTAAPAIPASVSDWWGAKITELLNVVRPGTISTNGKGDLLIADTPVTTIALSPEANEVFTAWREVLEPRLRPGVGDLTDIGPWAKKLGSYVSRLALLLNMLQDKPGPAVVVETMNAAIAWEPFIVGHCRALLAKQGHPKALKVIEWVQQNGFTEFTKRDMLLRLREKGFNTNADWEPILANLVATGHIRRKEAESLQRGRPSEVYEVRPELLEH
jgi:hypothetical protein